MANEVCSALIQHCFLLTELRILLHYSATALKMLHVASLLSLKAIISACGLMGLGSKGQFSLDFLNK